MRIALIVAMAQNRCIGQNGKLPWHLPGDLQRFKQLTMGQTLLMGRRTWQSIGRPLPGREIIVMTRQAGFQASGAKLARSLEQAIQMVTTEQLFICGGADIYRQALPLAEIIYLTELLRHVEGDIFFPDIPPEQFQPTHSENYQDAGQPCRFSILPRKQQKLIPADGSLLLPPR